MPPPKRPMPGAGEAIPESLKKKFMDVRLKSFDATPSGVVGRYKLSWEVLGLTENIRLELSGEPIPAAGSKLVPALSTTVYRLEAYVDVLRRRLGEVMVPGRLESLERRVVVNATLLKNLIVEGINRNLEPGGRIQLREGSQPEVHILSNAGILVFLYFRLEVPHWFDADLDIKMEFRASVREVELEARPRFSLFPNSSVDLMWGWYEHLLGLGQTITIQAVGQKIIEALLPGALGNPLATGLGDTLYELWTTFAGENYALTRVESYTTEGPHLVLIGLPLVRNR